MTKLITNESSVKIYKDRYEFENEGIDGTLKRVARHISDNKDDEKEFYDLMSNGYFLPAGRTITNSGIGKSLTLNNCFNANHVEDSIEDIFEKVKLGATTHQKGGGIGYDFSKIRPKGTPTSNEAVASGVVSFMHVFDSQTQTITQGQRRGANMGVLNIYHPGIFDFLESKSYDEGRLTQFNLSVMVDNKFMNAVENNEDIHLHYPVYDENSKIIEDPSKWTYSKKVSALDLWNVIMKKAYETGEYGVLFYDNMNNDNNTWYIETIISTNPCAEYLSGTLNEYALIKYNIKQEDYMGACNLGSIHLHRLISNPFKRDARLEFEKLASTVFSAVKMLDAIIDINIFPHDSYKRYQENMRTIGLGVTGFHNMLSMLNMQYGSEESLQFTSELFDFISYHAYMASVELAKEKGSFHFLEADKFVQSGFIKRQTERNEDWEYLISLIKEHGIRNARILSVAPVGTMSLTFGDNCSSGIEPTFMNKIERTVKIGGQSDEHKQQIDVHDYAYRVWKDMFKEDPYPYKTALELGVKEHLDILKIVASYTDMSVSKTINIPTDYSFEKTKDVYMDAWKSNIKGCTIFRPNKIRKGIFNVSEESALIEQDIPRGYILDSSDDLIGRKIKLQTGCGSLHVSVFFDELTGEPMEIYLNKGGTGGCQGYMGGLSRMISLALRGGINHEEIIEQLKSVHSCPSYVVRSKTKSDTDKGNNCSGAIGFALERMIKEVQLELGIIDDREEVCIEPKKSVAQLKTNFQEDIRQECPDCKEKTLLDIGGCLTCIECGYSKCN